MDFKRPLAVVTPTLDGDVLAVLAGAQAAFTGREVHRMIGHSSDVGVRKALHRLSRQGVVLVEPAGRAYLYRLNREHLAAPHIEGLADLRRELFARLRKRIDDWPLPVVYAAVFGTVSTEGATADSDLDLFLVRPRHLPVDHHEWRDQVDALSQAASAWTGNDARVLEYGEDELTNAATEPVLRDIRREARHSPEPGGPDAASERAMTARTRPCDATLKQGRMAKARQFLAAAEEIRRLAGSRWHSTCVGFRGVARVDGPIVP